MLALLEITSFYLATALASGTAYYLYTNQTQSFSKILTFAFINPLVWTTLAVLSCAAGIYYYILPNKDTSLAIAACLTTLPSASLSHWAIKE